MKEEQGEEKTLWVTAQIYNLASLLQVWSKYNDSCFFPELISYFYLFFGVCDSFGHSPNVSNEA